MSNVTNIADKLEQEAKRMKCNIEIEALGSLLSNVENVLKEFEESTLTFQRAHGSYTENWRGASRDSYDQYVQKLNINELRVVELGNQLKNEIDEQMDRLHAKVEELK
ncbi:hypothetical protein R7236_25700 [Priestia megaterium]|uniref:hypothetical protein n=1 Tax=Priestia megaterium TaxID=1404 RepID=UPI00296EA3B1|nr:hypothetical protein [Priestia megaterium]MDW4511789.1 hypothetical protein [Priestia megaterium]